MQIVVRVRLLNTKYIHALQYVSYTYMTITHARKYVNTCMYIYTYMRVYAWTHTSMQIQS